MPEIEGQVRTRYQMVNSHLNERGRRLMLAAEARALGHGGVAIVSRATGASRPMIARGRRELAGNDVPSNGKVRRGGGGRKRLGEGAPGLNEALGLIEPTTRGDPESPVRWTCKSTRVRASELRKQGDSVSHVNVATMLHARQYSLPSNRKIEEGGDHPDRDAQFHHIQSNALDFQEANQPVISVDAKKKELIGNDQNAGREWSPEGDAPTVKVYDVIGKLGKVTPEVVVSLIGTTTTTTGRMVRAELDAASSPIGRQITEKEMEALRIARDTFHGEWNDKLTPITRA